MNIPIANVYYLLCYAWGHAEESDLVRLEDLEGLSRVHDMLGHLLGSGTLRLIRRGLDRGYREVREAPTAVRAQCGRRFGALARTMVVPPAAEARGRFLRTAGSVSNAPAAPGPKRR